MIRIATIAFVVFLPVAILAESKTPSIGYTGAPADHAGQDCSTCHNSFGAANSDKSGSLQVTFSVAGGGYVPSVQQDIHIVVQRPGSSIWGFQVTIREQNNESMSAGTFAIPTASMNEQVVCEDGSQYGSATACGTTTATQFAEHDQAPMATGSYAFDVLWTPPSQEVGRVDVYVAAVAGNQDGTPQGDYVYTSKQTLENLGTCSLIGLTPSFNNLQNAASFQPTFSSGSMVSIFGMDFQTSGRTRTAGPGDYVNGAYPTELGCLGVQVTGPGVTQPVSLPIMYVSPGQINAQMPEFTGTGPVMLTVTLNPGASSGVNSPVATINSLQAFSPAFFTFPNSTSIAAEVANTYTIVADPSVVAGASPAQPGDVVSLYGTGFGDVTPASAGGLGMLANGQASLTNPITVTIGGVTVDSSDVWYAGLSPGSISGLYQFNVKIPASTAAGNVPVIISVGGVQTQTGATIPIQ
jgi:uncharacterized protein (TIGR03437 family)